MMSVNVFSPAFASFSASRSNLSSSLSRPSKRKRVLTLADSDSGQGENPGNRSPTQQTPFSDQTGHFTTLSNTLSLSTDVQIQSQSFQVEDKRLVGSSSPQADPSQTSKLFPLNAEVLTHVEPPLLISRAIASSAASRSGLRQRHLATIIAVLHRCMLEGDYCRAGRAWGLLLRCEFNGHPMDPRCSDRWGVGAEILVQSEAQTQERSVNYESIELDKTTAFSKRHSSILRGFEKAKDYYERLILQYPYRKVSPHTTGPLDFYLAVFSLWIRFVDDQYSQAKSESAENEGSRHDNIDNSTARNEEAVLLEENILQETILRAQEIESRLDHLSSPPYTDRADFWKLKGMVAQWIADLLSVTLGLKPDPMHDTNYKSFSTDNTNLTDFGVDTYGRNVTNEKDKAMLRAELAFQEVVSLGGRPPR